MALRTTAPAKVNLALRVTGRRGDGYHGLESVFLRLRLADELTLSDAPGPGDGLVIEGEPRLAVEGNLVSRAVAAFRGAARVPVGPVAVRLRKRVPLAAGLAGGSSDAAAVLRLLARRVPEGSLGTPLVALAAGIGADVPFFVDAAGAALVRGIGELVEPLPPPIEPLGVVLVIPPFGLATREVFAAWDALHPDGHDVSGTSDVAARLAVELRAGAEPATIVGLAPELRDANDLWPAAVAVEPRMAVVRDALEAHLGRPVLMTGSGSTLVCLAPTADDAGRIAEGLVREPPAGLLGARVEASASGTPYPPEVVIEEEAA